MNFFGHALVACAQDGAPRFVLGAMLPDLAGMARVRITRVADAELARGVALHHETDRVFHAVPAFRAACNDALATLEPRGVSRGSARAVGHVGSELLLDGLLATDQRARDAYARALDAALRDDLARSVEWSDGADAERLRVLLARLQAAPLPERYRDLDFVCDRLQAILAQRPRLSLQPNDLRPVRAWLDGALVHLARERGAILDAVMRSA